MPNRIVVLDPETANQIAAGEVVERPASVVKELVENAIDAGASRVSVEVEEGGHRLIRVQDDGCGMSQQDVVLAFQRHATSKIRTAEDLVRVTTLGFRGEALPSIASVSQVEIITCEQPSTEEGEMGSSLIPHPSSDVPNGIRLVVEGGVLTDVCEIGAPPGTTVSVKNLFFNTPARLKFMKSVNTEMGHISDLVVKLALSHPHLAIAVTHQGEEVIRSPGGADMLATLVSVYGREVARHLLPVQFIHSGIHVTGYVSRPNVTRASREHQSFFVNRRLVRSKSLTHALNEAYRNLVSHGRFPIAVLSVALPPELVDVNVHPTKTEVRFAREWEVHNIVMRAVHQTLASAQLIPEMDIPQPERSTGQEASPSSFQQALRTKAGLPLAAETTGLPRLGQQTLAVTGSPALAPSIGRWGAEGKLKGKQFHAIGQIRNTYILAESEEGLFIIDQHTAHERVLYDQKIARADGKPLDRQQLMMPLTLELSRREAAVLEENREVLGELGFDVEPFGKDSFVVRSIPVLLANQNYEQAFRDLVDELVVNATTHQMTARKEAVMAMVSCKSAVKAGERLKPEEIATLVENLFNTTNPFLCPHGRPTIVSLSHLELDKRFGRA